MSDTVSRLAEQAQDGVAQATKAARATAENAVETLSRQGERAVDGATHLVRDQPLLTVAATALVGLILGVLLARR